jgi:hypothetical protein
MRQMKLVIEAKSPSRCRFFPLLGTTQHGFSCRVPSALILGVWGISSAVRLGRWCSRSVAAVRARLSPLFLRRGLLPAVRQFGVRGAADATATVVVRPVAARPRLAHWVAAPLDHGAAPPSARAEAAASAPSCRRCGRACGTSRPTCGAPTSPRLPSGTPTTPRRPPAAVPRVPHVAVQNVQAGSSHLSRSRAGEGASLALDGLNDGVEVAQLPLLQCSYCDASLYFLRHHYATEHPAALTPVRRVRGQRRDRGVASGLVARVARSPA